MPAPARAAASPTSRSTGAGTRRLRTTSAMTAATLYAPVHAHASPWTPSDGNSASASAMFTPFSIALIQKGVKVSVNA